MARFPDAFVGYRTWRLEGGRLYGANGEAWEVGDTPTEAICAGYAERKHKAPQLDCGCGLHAFYELPEDLYLREGVLGAVVAWGRHMKASNGFRTEFALPVALGRHGKMQLDEYEAAQAYCAEWELPFCDSFEELEAEALRYADPVPEELRTKRGESAPPNIAAIEAAMKEAPGNEGYGYSGVSSHHFGGGALDYSGGIEGWRDSYSGPTPAPKPVIGALSPGAADWMKAKKVMELERRKRLQRRKARIRMKANRPKGRRRIEGR